MKTKHLSSKRKFLVRGLLLVVAIMLWGNSQHVSAQWSTSGTNVYYNGGNVGIGTASPGNKLEVKAGTGSSDASVDGLALFNTNTYYTTKGRAGVNFDSLFISQNSRFNGSAWVSDDTGKATAQIRLDANNASGQIYFYTASSNNAGQGTERMRIDKSGNVGIGTTNPTVALDVVGSVNVTGNINAKYQDLAEWVPASEQLPAGTVVVLDSTKSNQITTSTQSYDTSVAGVVSEQPGIALGEGGSNKVLVATTGRVLVKVDASRAAVHIGDLLVTSNVPGAAMKSEPINIGGVQLHRPGTLIGKALEPLEKGSGKILVLLSLQ